MVCSYLRIQYFPLYLWGYWGFFFFLLYYCYFLWFFFSCLLLLVFFFFFTIEWFLKHPVNLIALRIQEKGTKMVNGSSVCAGLWTDKLPLDDQAGLKCSGRSLGLVHCCPLEPHGQLYSVPPTPSPIKAHRLPSSHAATPHRCPRKER